MGVTVLLECGAVSTVQPDYVTGCLLLLHLLIEAGKYLSAVWHVDTCDQDSSRDATPQPCTLAS